MTMYEKQKNTGLYSGTVQTASSGKWPVAVSPDRSNESLVSVKGRGLLDQVNKSALSIS